MKQIISNIHRQWLIAKEQMRQRCEQTNNTDMAHRLAVCDMFKGTETLSELAELFTSPQGLEFCLSACFPNLATLRFFKRHNPQRFGIHIDAGEITLHNPRKAILIGRTIATIKCDTCERHEIVTMHGASATVLASGWSVVSATAGRGTNITRRAIDNAIIL